MSVCLLASSRNKTTQRIFVKLFIKDVSLYMEASTKFWKLFGSRVRIQTGRNRLGGGLQFPCAPGTLYIRDLLGLYCLFFFFSTVAAYMANKVVYIDYTYTPTFS